MSIKLIYKNLNFQNIISYFGILPFIIIFIDIHITNFLFLNILKDFAIFYTLIIFSFIGAMRWSFDKNLNGTEIIYGFFPSLISTILIIYNLFSYSKDAILFVIIIFLFFQLVGDFIIYKKNNQGGPFLKKVRFPITLIIIFNIIYLISV